MKHGSSIFVKAIRFHRSMANPQGNSLGVKFGNSNWRSHVQNQQRVDGGLGDGGRAEGSLKPRV